MKDINVGFSIDKWYLCDLITIWFKDNDFFEKTIDRFDVNYVSSASIDYIDELKRFVVNLKTMYSKYFTRPELKDVVKYSIENSRDDIEVAHYKEFMVKFSSELSEERIQYIKSTFKYYQVYVELAKLANMTVDMLNETKDGAVIKNFEERVKGVLKQSNNIKTIMNIW